MRSYNFAGLPPRKCRILSEVRFTSGRLGIVIARRAHYNQPLNHGGEQTLSNFREYHYRIWRPNRGAQWYTQDAFEVVQDHEVLVDAIAAIRGSEVNPPEWGLLLVNNLSADVAPDMWRLELVQMDELFADDRARLLAAWNNNEVPRADVLRYYSSSESSLAGRDGLGLVDGLLHRLHHTDSQQRCWPGESFPKKVWYPQKLSHYPKAAPKQAMHSECAAPELPQCPSPSRPGRVRPGMR